MSGGTPLANPNMAFVPTPPTPPPATIAATSGTYVTGIMNAAGYRALAAACTLSQGGTIVIQRYVDPAGTIPLGAAISATLTANVSQYVEVHDGAAAAAWQVTVSNTGGSTGNLSGVAFLASM